MRPVIKYISFYDFADSGIARNYSVAAANKMDYIIESLVRIGYDVEVDGKDAATPTAAIAPPLLGSSVPE